jgi:uncharacterized protein (DUF2147 family)
MNVFTTRLFAGLLCSIALLGFLFFDTEVIAQSSDIPTGLWKTIDDESGQVKSQVRIWEHKGILYGKIVKLVNPDTPNPVCSKCEGMKKNQPIEGMQIIWGLKKSDSNWWEGGKILDPKNGKKYRCKLRPIDGGKRLEVRGFIGISLLGRSQTWYRI